MGRVTYLGALLLPTDAMSDRLPREKCLIAGSSRSLNNSFDTC